MAEDATIPDGRISKATSILPNDPKKAVPYTDFATLLAALSSMGEIHFGTVVGTGASLPVTGLPFDPAAVIVWNQTDPGLYVHLPSMTAAHMAKLTDAPALTHATSLGITLGAKGARSFTIGADTDMNAAADALHYIVFGNRKLLGSS